MKRKNEEEDEKKTRKRKKGRGKGTIKGRERGKGKGTCFLGRRKVRKQNLKTKTVGNLFLVRRVQEAKSTE